MRTQPRISGPIFKLANGKLISIISAPYFYACEQCLSPIKRQGAGLKCTTNPDHRGFITKAEAEEVEQFQKQNIEELKNVYEIVDGKVVVK